MRQPIDTKRRKVLKLLGGSAVGSLAVTDSAVAHGDNWNPVWFEGEIWELTARPPFGDNQDEGEVPIWNMEPDAGGNGCAQLQNVDPSPILTDKFDKKAWKGIDLDHVLSANPFSALWHNHFIFEADARVPYTPSDLENEGVGGEPLTSGAAVRRAVDANVVKEVSIPFGFNCPLRPADDAHRNYCD